METVTYSRKRGRTQGAPFAFATPKRRRTYGVRRRRTLTRRSKLGSEMGIELKFYDTSLVSDNIQTNSDGAGLEVNPSAVITLNTITQGDGESQRDGRNCIVKSLHLKGIINVPVQTNVTVADQAGCIFIALVEDRQTNGAIFASENVYINPGANIILGASLQRNLQFVKRFRVLKTVKLDLPMPTLTWDGTNMEQAGYMLPFEIHVPRMSVKTNFSGTTEDVANITDSSLNLLATTSAIGLAPTMSYNCRVRFVG